MVVSRPRQIFTQSSYGASILALVEFPTEMFDLKWERNDSRITINQCGSNPCPFSDLNQSKLNSDLNQSRIFHVWVEEV